VVWAADSSVFWFTLVEVGRITYSWPLRKFLFRLAFLLGYRA
jgi:hypothetical protein